jgi:tetratricopeptide (TPR) repeat protein
MAIERQPYPGLRAFNIYEADIFFGRDRALDSMIEILAHTRFLAVLGHSGSGKSSLVRTGLVQSLSLGHFYRAGCHWLVADMHPGGRPLHNLSTALLQAVNKQQNDGDADVLAAYLRRAPRAIVDWAEGNIPEGTNLLILADQFEELFRYADYAEREEAEAFARLLLECSQAPSMPRIYVALTMRSEYLGSSTLLPGLGEAINDGLYLTPRMTREECREAIEGPALILDFEVEPRLITRILNDLSSFAPWDKESTADRLQELSRRADQLPLMQHMLNRLWQQAGSDQRSFADRAENGGEPVTLTLAQYDRLGGLRGALDAHGEELTAAVDSASRRHIPTIFKALVDGPSTADAVRRPCPLSEMIALADGDRAGVIAVVDVFRAPESHFIRPAFPTPLSDDTIIDLSHESLIRQWTSLSVWVEEEAASAAMWQRLMTAESGFREGTADLLSGLQLANCRNWWDNAGPTAAWAARYGGDFSAIKQFLSDSIAAEQARVEAEAQREAREKRRHRWFVGVLALLTAASSGIAAVAWNQRSELLRTEEQLVVSLADASAARDEAQARLQDMSGWLQQISDVIREQEESPILGFDNIRHEIMNVLYPFQQYLLDLEPDVVSPEVIARTYISLARREEERGNVEQAVQYLSNAFDIALNLTRYDRTLPIPPEVADLLVESAVFAAWHHMNLEENQEAAAYLEPAHDALTSRTLETADHANLYALAQLHNAMSRLSGENGEIEADRRHMEAAVSYISLAYIHEPHDFRIQRSFLSYLRNQYRNMSEETPEKARALEEMCVHFRNIFAENRHNGALHLVGRECTLNNVEALMDEGESEEARQLLLDRERDLSIHADYSPNNISTQVRHIVSVADILNYSGFRGDGLEFTERWLSVAIEKVENISSARAAVPVELGSYQNALDEISASIGRLENDSSRLDAYTRLWEAISETTNMFPQLEEINIVAGFSARYAANILIRNDQYSEGISWLERAQLSYRNSGIFESDAAHEQIAEKAYPFASGAVSIS